MCRRGGSKGGKHPDDVTDINVGNISNRTPQIAIFDFKVFLNMAMLLAESENAKVLRQIMLDMQI